MKTKLIPFIAVITILISCLVSCSSVKESSNKKPPFKITSATYNNWIGGQPGVNGVVVKVVIDNPKVTLDSVYFRNMKTEFEKTKNTSEEIYIGHFTYPNSKKDVILHSDPKKEFGNEVPDISKKIPFELNKDEAVVSYIYKGIKNYFKISNLIETTSK